MKEKYTIKLTQNQASQLNDVILGFCKGSWAYNPPKRLEVAREPEQGFEDGKKAAYEQGFKDAQYKEKLDIQDIENRHRDELEHHYDDGRKDTWNMVHRILYMLQEERMEVFGSSGLADIFSEDSVYKISDALKRYDEKQQEKEIKVGDELINGIKCVVTYIGDLSYLVLYSDGTIGTIGKTCNCKKTGKNIADKLEELFEDE